MSLDRSHHTFKDTNKNNLEWDNVAKEVDYPDSKAFLRRVSQNITS